MLIGCGGGAASSTQQSTDPSERSSLSWSAPISNTNGSPIADLAGYRIHYGTSPGVYTGSINVPADKTRYAISDFSISVHPIKGATYYISVTAYDYNNNESAYSNEITKIFD